MLNVPIRAEGSKTTADSSSDAMLRARARRCARALESYGRGELDDDRDRRIALGGEVRVIGRLILEREVECATRGER